METLFMTLEKNPADTDCINEIFRLMHNTKGSSRAVGLDSMAKLAHSAENILSEIRNGKVSPSLKIVNALLQSLDAMKAGSEEIKNGNDNTDIFDIATNSLLSATKAGFESSSPNPPSTDSSPLEASVPSTNETDTPIVDGYVDFGVENSYLNQEASSVLPDLASLPNNNSGPEAGLPQVANPAVALALATGSSAPSNSSSTKLKSDESIRISLNKLEEIQNIFGEQIILQSALDHALSQDPIDTHQSEKLLAQLRKISVSLQNLIISLRMVPVSSILGRLSRAVRDVAISTNKLAEITIEGGDCELDKNILDQLIDPLVHMVRNSVDHGIETPEERKLKNKPEGGSIKIAARRLGSHFEFKINDDGKGLSKERILEKAHALGVVPKGFVPENKDIYKLIFASGFSTKPAATEFSGRGVGMDVVQQKVNSLKGSIDIDSVQDAGSTFTIRIPLSLAIFNGTVVKVGDEKYVIPNSDFRETIALDTSKNRNSTDQKGVIIEFNNELLRIIDLRERLGSKTPRKLDQRNIALVVEKDDQKYACVVSDILYQEQIVLKEMGPETKMVREATGGTILGDGKVALIIDLGKVITTKGIAA
jgi:two-component system chemotaxis sensor kinase CheA